MDHSPDPEHQLPALAARRAARHRPRRAPECELAAWYPDIAERVAAHRRCRRRTPAPTSSSNTASRLAAHARNVRTLQTNDVGRCALLLAAIAAAGPPAEPIALVDVGCSAGLNLRPRPVPLPVRARRRPRTRVDRQADDGTRRRHPGTGPDPRDRCAGRHRSRTGRLHGRRGPQVASGVHLARSVGSARAIRGRRRDRAARPGRSSHGRCGRRARRHGR